MTLAPILDGLGWPNFVAVQLIGWPGDGVGVLGGFQRLDAVAELNEAGANFEAWCVAFNFSPLLGRSAVLVGRLRRLIARVLPDDLADSVRRYDRNVGALA